MSNIHVLAGAGRNRYTVLVHVATPAGNNSAGVAWSTAVINAKRNTTVLATGTAAGQITSAEAAQVAAGTVLEGSFEWDDDPAWTNGQRTADLDTRAAQLAAELLARFGADLKFFGFTR